MAKFKVHVFKADPEILRCSTCNCVLARWESVYGGQCHLCADDPYMDRRSGQKI